MIFLNSAVVCSRIQADIGSHSGPFMPSVQPMIAAMDAVNLELATYFGHLAKPWLMGCQ